jgi:mRNA interferase MazF
MKRGEVYDARLDPTEGSEQAGSRPIIIVSRDIINSTGRVILGVPCTTYRPGRRVFATQVLIHPPDGGLSVGSVALCEQVRALSKTRLFRYRGELAPGTLRQIERALAIAFNLPRN